MKRVKEDQLEMVEIPVGWAELKSQFFNNVMLGICGHSKKVCLISTEMNKTLRLREIESFSLDKQKKMCVEGMRCLNFGCEYNKTSKSSLCKYYKVSKRELDVLIKLVSGTSK